MITLPDDLFVDALGYSRAERLGASISTQDKAALLAELAVAELTGASLDERLDYLNTPRLYDRGDAPLVTVDVVGFKDLQRWVSNRLATITVQHPQLATKWALLAAGFLSAQVATDPVRSDSTKLAGIVAGLVADGIEPHLEELFSSPDPNWQREVWETPAAHVLSARVIVQAGDLA